MRGFFMHVELCLSTTSLILVLDVVYEEWLLREGVFCSFQKPVMACRFLLLSGSHSRCWGSNLHHMCL